MQDTCQAYIQEIPNKIRVSYKGLSSLLRQPKYFYHLLSLGATLLYVQRIVFLAVCDIFYGIPW